MSQTQAAIAVRRPFAAALSIGVVLIFAATAGAAAAEDEYKGSEKYGLPVTSDEVYEYIADLGEFGGKVWDTMLADNEGYSAATKQKLKDLQRACHLELEERLLGTNQNETKQTLQFYEDTLRVLRKYREILKVVGRDDPLFDLMRDWDRALVECYRSPNPMAEFPIDDVLRRTEEKLAAADVPADKREALKPSFQILAQLYRDIAKNPSSAAAKKMERSLEGSPAEVQELARKLDQAVRWSFVTNQQKGIPSLDSFRAAMRRLR